MRRFDYITYDDQAAAFQLEMKTSFQLILKTLTESLCMSRERQLALTKLEETYVWVCKAVGEDQLQRTAVPPKLSDT